MGQDTMLIDLESYNWYELLAIALDLGAVSESEADEFDCADLIELIEEAWCGRIYGEVHEKEPRKG